MLMIIDAPEEWKVNKNQKSTGSQPSVFSFNFLLIHISRIQR
jgi:hypothetical protein